MPLVRRTRATLRSAEFGFFGVWVKTRTQTPRFCGLSCSAGLLVLVMTAARPLRTNWLIVGTIAPRAPDLGAQKTWCSRPREPPSSDPAPGTDLPYKVDERRARPALRPGALSMQPAATRLEARRLFRATQGPLSGCPPCVSRQASNTLPLRFPKEATSERRCRLNVVP